MKKRDTREELQLRTVSDDREGDTRFSKCARCGDLFLKHKQPLSGDMYCEMCIETYNSSMA